MALSPLCQVKNGSASFVATANGVNLTPGSTITVKLADTTDVVDWYLVVLGTDETTTPPSLSGVNSTTNKVTAPTTQVTFPLVSGLGRAILFESTVTGPGGPLVTTFAVYTLTATGTRVGAAGEQREGDGTYGWASKVNPLLRQGAPVLRYDDSAALPSLGVTSVQQAIDALKSVSGTFVAGTDLSGTSSSQTVIGLRGRLLDTATPNDGDILRYNLGQNKWLVTALPTSSSFTAAGDLGGSSTSQTVVGLAGIPLQSGTPTATYTIAYNGTIWAYVPFPSGAFTAAGDLSGSSSSQVVAGLRGRSLSTSVPNIGDVYQWNGTVWAPAAISGGGGSISVQQVGGGTPPVITGVTTVKFANSTVTNNGSGVVTVTPTTSGGSTATLDNARSTRQALSWGLMADKTSGNYVSVLSGSGSSQWLGSCWDGRYVWAVDSNGSGTTSRVVKSALYTGLRGGLAGAEVVKYAADLGVSSFLPNDICFDGQDLWVSDATNNVVYRLDRYGYVQNTVTVTGPNRLEFDGENVWASQGTGVTKITLGGTATFLSLTGSVEHMVFDGRYLWCGGLSGSCLYKVDPFAGTLSTTITLPTRPRAVCFDGTWVWAVSDTGQCVYRVHSETGVIETLSLSALLTSPTGIGFDGRVIVVADGSYHVTINPFSFRVLRGQTIYGACLGPLRSAGEGALVGQGPGHDLIMIVPPESKQFSRVISRRGLIRSGSYNLFLGSVTGTIYLRDSDDDPEEAECIAISGTLTGTTRIEPTSNGPWVIDNQMTHGGNTLRFGSSSSSVVLVEGKSVLIYFNPQYAQFKTLFST